MPLPKMPTQPATMLLAKDYPKAEPGKSPVRPVSAQANDDVEDLISGQAVPTPKSRARRKATDTLAAAQAPASAPVSTPVTAAAPAAVAANEAASEAPNNRKPGKAAKPAAAPA